MRLLWVTPCIIAFLAGASARPQALTQKEACAKFSDAVVRIDGAGQSLGSGFIVSSDGYVLTASHVIRDESGKPFAAIFVTLSNGQMMPANPVIAPSPESVGQDFVILKIDGQTKLPFLTLGSVEEVVTGGDATIIGFPFSALDRQDEYVKRKFCLAALFAASDIETIPVHETHGPANGISQIVDKNVQVDVIYFQGPSVKGISGSPIISRDTGNVVGIVSTKLSGISPALEQLKEFTGQPQQGQVGIMGVNPVEAFNQITTVLDLQLANGLGSAVGIDDPKEALKRAQRHKK